MALLEIMFHPLTREGQPDISRKDWVTIQTNMIAVICDATLPSLVAGMLKDGAMIGVNGFGSFVVPYSREEVMEHIFLAENTAKH